MHGAGLWLLAAALAIGAVIRLIGSAPPAQPLLCRVLGQGCPAFVYRGYVARGWEPVLNLARENFERGYDIGTQLTVYHKGEVVVDIATGYNDTSFTAPYEADTLQIVMSVSKSLASLAIVMLVDRGHLRFNDPVAKHWPEFAQGGKERVTVSDVLSHGSGVHGVSELIDYSIMMENGQRLGDLLAASELDERTWRQKGGQAYHALTHGLLLDQICRRVDPDRRSVAQFIEEEIVHALGRSDFLLGVPPNSPLLERVGPVIDMTPAKLALGILPRLVLPRSIWSTLLDDISISDTEIGFYIDSQTPGTISHRAFNIFADQPQMLHEYADERWRQIQCPSSHVFTTSRVLASVANVLANGGTDPEIGVRLVSPKTLEWATTRLPWDVDKAFQSQIQYTIGGWGDLSQASISAPWNEIPVSSLEGKCLGWTGAGGSWLQFCEKSRLGFGYTMNRYGPHVVDWRGINLLAVAHDVAEKLG